jgi:O-antigen ligase
MLSVERIKIYLLYLVVFLIPFNYHLLPIIIGILLVMSFFQSNFFENIRNNYLEKIYFPILYYLILIVGLSYSENLREGLFDLEVKASFLVFPAIFLNLKSLTAKELKIIFKLFLNACILASFVCLAHSLIFDKSDSLNYLEYSKLTFFIHPSYFALYLLFASVICIHLLREEKRLMKIIIIASLFFLISMILMISSRAGILALIVVFPFLIFEAFQIKGSYRIWSGIGIIVIASILFFRFNDRLSNVLDASYYTSTKSDESISARYHVYMLTAKAISELVWLGTGTGDAKQLLMEQYKQNGIDYAYNKKLNAHNQFAETWLTNGIFSFLLLSLSMLFSFFRAVRSNYFLQYAFVLITTVHFFFESMLNTQAGVVFFTFFWLLLELYRKESSKINLIEVSD